MDFLRLELPKTFLSTSSPTSSASLTNKSGLGDENVGNESLLMAMPSNRSRVKLLRHVFFVEGSLITQKLDLEPCGLMHPEGDANCSYTQ